MRVRSGASSSEARLTEVARPPADGDGDEDDDDDEDEPGEGATADVTTLTT